MKKTNTSVRLNQLISERNLKQVDILNKCRALQDKYDVKIGRNHISQYVNGKVEPGQLKLSLLAEALNVSEAWLMGYDVPMSTEKEKSAPATEKQQVLIELVKQLDDNQCDIMSNLINQILSNRN